MTHFVNPDYPAQHRGVERAEAAFTAVQHLNTGFKGAKGLAAMLVAGAISALMVVADQIVSTWTDGHLLLAWVALWAVVFAAMALFAEATRGWSARLVTALEARSQAAAQRAADEQVWAAAQSDPRFMADIQAARLRAEREALAAGEPQPHWPFADLPTHRVARYKLF